MSDRRLAADKGDWQPTRIREGAGSKPFPSELSCPANASDVSLFFLFHPSAQCFLTPTSKLCCHIARACRGESYMPNQLGIETEQIRFYIQSPWRIDCFNWSAFNLIFFAFARSYRVCFIRYFLTKYVLIAAQR